MLDNASTDGSVEAIRAKYPEVEIHPLAQNLGYAGNNNVGIRRALAMDADWVLLLNEDVVVGADALRVMLEAAGGRANVGFVGPMVYHYDEPEIIQSAGGRLGPGWQAIHVGQNSVDRGEFASPRSVQWVFVVLPEPHGPWMRSDGLTRFDSNMPRIMSTACG